MASPATTETIEIRRRGRRRLIGAIAIVVLLVVFLPMLLDTEQHRGTSEPSTQIPSKENAPPLPAPQKPAPAPVKPAPESAAPATPTTVAPAKPAPATRPASAPVAASSPASRDTPHAAALPTQAAPRLEGFAVQVGAFKDEETLKQARAKLALAGVAYYTERIGGGLTRLRAGPFPTREAAEKARGALKEAALDGQVVPLP